ncbi:MAG: CHAT domain-containing protein [Bacteroidetes bacterium]|nr:CHAT domain-containing protein [Bacteroidota bacterium]
MWFNISPVFRSKFTSITIISVIVLIFYTIESHGQKIDNTYQVSSEFEKIRDSLNSNILSPDTQNFNSIIDRFYKITSENSKILPVELWIDNIYDLGIVIWGKRDTTRFINLFTPIFDNTWDPQTDLARAFLGRSLNLLGIVQKKNTQLNDAVGSYMAGLSYFLQCDTIEPRYIPVTYGNTRNAYRRLGNFSMAVELLSESDRYFELNITSSENDQVARNQLIMDQITHLSNLGLALQASGATEKAINTHLRASELAQKLKHNSRALILSNLAVSYQTNGDLILAEKSIIQALETFPADSVSISWANYSINYLSIMIELNKTDDFLKEFNKIRTITNSLQYSLRRNRLLSISYVQEALHYKKSGNSEKSLELLQSALYYLDTDRTLSLDWHQLPVGRIRQNPMRFLEVIDFKAQNLIEMFNSLGEISYGYEALNHLKLAEQWTDSIRITIDNHKSRVILNNIQNSIFQRKTDLCYQLYSKNGDQHFLNEAFASCEKGKAAGMWTEIQLADLKSELIPADLTTKEQDLLSRSLEINALINEEIERSRTGSKVLLSLQAQKIATQTSIDSLINIFNSEYPEYFSLKYANTTISLPEIMNQLEDNTVMIQYFTAMNKLHQIVITNNNVEYNTISNLSEIYEYKSALLSNMNQPVFDYTREIVKEYIRSGYGLYSALLSNVKTDLSDKEIIILPDVFLADLPFEALVTDSSFNNDTDFRDLSYLLIENRISYSYTATLWAYQSEKELARSRVGHILAYSPSYDPALIQSFENWKDLAPVLPELSGTIKEIDFIHRSFKSRTFNANMASEQSFKKFATNSDVIHLAMHSVLDEQNPLQSGLAFTPGSDNLDNGILTAAEILNVKLNASLTVLSACNTGAGKIEAVEGIMSLARSFIIAGSQGIVLTLWPLDDRIGQKLINNFYQTLKNGSSVAEALRSSKIVHLSKADKLMAHPYFWAGLVSLGHDQEINLKKRSILPWLLPLLIVLIILVSQFIQNKKKAVAKATARNG